MACVIDILRFYYNTKISTVIERAVRTVYLNPTITVATFSTVSVALLWKYTSARPIVLVTMFYAGILLFNSIFRGAVPMPVIDPNVNNYNEDYLDNADFETSEVEVKGEKTGFKTTFKIQNLGSGVVRKPKIQFQVYDQNKCLIQSWTTVGGEDRNALTIEPGKELTDLHVRGGPLEKNGDAFFYIILRIKPGLGYSIVSDRTKVKAGD